MCPFISAHMLVSQVGFTNQGKAVQGKRVHWLSHSLIKASEIIHFQLVSADYNCKPFTNGVQNIWKDKHHSCIVLKPLTQ